MASKSLDKIIDEISVLTVLELAELTKALEDKFGVSVAMPVAAAAPAGKVTAAAEEKTEFKVEIIDAGTQKIKAIKALRKVKKDIGLTEAKKMVESAPVVIAEAVSKEEAATIKKEFEEAGVTIKIS